MLPLETKQSGDKLLLHSDLRGGEGRGFLGEASHRIQREMKLVARMGEERGAYRVLVGKLDGKRPLGRPRRRWVENIRMELQELRCGYMD